MNKLNILHVANVRFYNATMWYAFYLSRQLEQLGHNSKVLTLEGTLSDKKAKELNISQISMPYNQKKISQLPNIYRFLDKELQKLQPDIVNCHRGELYPLFVQLKKKYGYKLVRTRGDQRSIKKNLINKYLYTKVSDAVIGTNSAIHKSLLKLGMPQSKAFSVLGGVDTTVFYRDIVAGEKARAMYGYTDSDCVIGLLGRLDPVKGHAEAIHALAKAVHEYKAKNLKLCIIGFDEITRSEDFYVLADTLGVRDRLCITGRVEDVNACLNMCDVGLIASIGSEAIARAAVEFIACEIPLISSKIGVMPDLVSEEGLFKARDIEAMAKLFLLVSQALDAKHLKEYTKEREWLEQLQKSQQALIPELTLEAFAKKTLDIYNKLV